MNNSKWKKATALGLVLIFLVTLTARLFFAFQSEHFTLGSSYFNLRQVEHISNTGLPLIQDDLSYQGRIHLTMPIFYYLLGFFNLFLPLTIVGKIIPNIFASTLVFIIYLICKDITHDRELSLLGGLLAGFVPFYFSKTFNNISVQSLVVPMIFLMIYLMFRAKSKNHVKAFLVLTFILVLTSPVSLLLLGGFIVYSILAWTLKVRVKKINKELMMFYSIASVWLISMFYQNALLNYGQKIIWQNIPAEILGKYFTEITLIGVIMNIGVISSLVGFYIVYKYLFIKKNTKLLLLIGFLISTGLLTWFKLIKPVTGFMYVSIIMVILFMVFIKELPMMTKETKFSQYRYLIMILLGVVFIISSLLPSIASAMQELDKTSSAVDYLKAQQFPESATIVAHVDQGNLIQFYTKRKTVADLQFLLAPNPAERLKDLKTIYTTKFETEAIRLMEKYGAMYIYTQQETLDRYNVTFVDYLQDTECFEKQGNFYKRTCELKAQNGKTS